MFGKTFTLFKVLGFTVRVDLSWIVIVVLVVWSLAGGVFPEQYKALSAGTHLAMGIVAAAGLFASIVVHELCHSLVARRFGLPMEGITLFLFGGVAEMGEEPPSPKAEFLIAIAGPAASAVIAGAFLSAAWLGRATGWPDSIRGVVQWIGYINAMLVAFNLIPGFPLDGGRVLRSALWQWRGDLRRATRAASRVGAAFGVGLIGLGFLTLLLGNPIGGLWWILIGMFVRSAARQGYQQVLIREMLKGEPVRRFMNPQPVAVGPAMSVEQLVNDYIYRFHYKMFPVVEGARVLGCVTTKTVQGIPREQWGLRTVAEVASPCTEENTIVPEEDAVHAFTRMSQHHVSRLMVVQDGRLVGILTLKDLLKFLALKLELENHT
jgi:Zn-dependent protease